MNRRTTSTSTSTTLCRFFLHSYVPHSLLILYFFILVLLLLLLLLYRNIHITSKQNEKKRKEKASMTADVEKQEGPSSSSSSNSGDTNKTQPNTVHPFDPDNFDPLDDDGVEDTTWGEVCTMCCCHTPKAWAGIAFQLFWVLFFLYFFILGLEILGDGAQVITGCAAGALFGDDMNPVSGLMIGIICTVFLQSSSTTTSIIVTLVGAGAISVNQGTSFPSSLK
jgi:hypothetical protein